jgi:A/G-specific adenine glycosylase
MSNADFLSVLWQYYHTSARQMPWRTPEADGSFDFYKIALSEVMLQQTQVDRVLPKYLNFIAAFPTYASLADAPFAEVLSYWSGLGYNRRALYIHEWAKGLVDVGLPDSPQSLAQYKGFGVHTAAAVFVYAYNQPHIFIETNVRSVLLHHYFRNQTAVSDALLSEKLATVLDMNNPREFYWALMDYGTYLKKQHKNINHRSAQYKKQSAFQGSKRQLRGKILRYLQQKDRCTSSEIKRHINDDRTDECLLQLQTEGFIVCDGNWLSLSN